MSATSSTRARPCAPCPDRASDRSGHGCPRAPLRARSGPSGSACHEPCRPARSRGRRHASWMRRIGGSTGIVGIRCDHSSACHAWRWQASANSRCRSPGAVVATHAPSCSKSSTLRARMSLQIPCNSAMPSQSLTSVSLPATRPRRRRGRSPVRLRRCTRATSPGTVHCTSSLPRMALMPHTTRSRITNVGRHVEGLDHGLMRALDVEHLADRVDHPLARERELVGEVGLVGTADVVVHEVGVESVAGAEEGTAPPSPRTSRCGSRWTTIASNVGCNVSHSPGDQRLTRP